MGKHHESGLMVRTVNENTLPSYAESISLSVISALMALSLLWFVCDMFSLQSGLLQILCCISAGFFYGFAQRNKQVKIIKFALPCVLVLLVPVFHSYFSDGFATCANKIMETIGRNQGRYFLPLSVNSDENKSAEIAVMCVFSVFIGILCGVIVKNRNRVFMCILSLLVVACACVFANTNGYSICLVVIVFAVGIAFSDKGAVGVLPLFAVCFGLSMGVVYFLGDTITPILEQADSYCHKIIDDVIYDTNQGGMTYGDFSKADTLASGKDIALEVVMENPQSYYLRGFVGSVYTEKGWEKSDSSKIYDKADVFYWLDKENFSSLTQLSECDMITNDGFAVGKVTVTVKNADTKYKYSPYELADFNNDNLLANENLLADFSAVEKVYSYTAVENLLYDYRKMAKAIYEDNTDTIKSYLAKESEYNELAHEMYTDVPENIANLLENHLGKAENLSADKAKEKIYQLCDGIEYAEDFKYGEGDFLQNFIERYGKGNSVCYATLAVEIFRYYGVPARYVEGYIITPAMIENLPEYSAVVVNEGDAHAWAEYYLDGVGWIAFEATPEFMGIMETDDNTGSDTATESGDGNSQMQSAQKLSDTDNGTEISKTQVEEKSEQSFVLPMIIGAVLICLLVIVIRIFVAYKRRKKIFYQQDLTCAVQVIFAYCFVLLGVLKIEKPVKSIEEIRDDANIKLGTNLCNDLFECAKTNEQARFSDKIINKTDFDKTIAFYKVLKKYTAKKTNSFKRFYLRYIRVIY